KVTILKDASATAVFGVRGANGVILVTTRQGNRGVPQINSTSGTAFQVPTKLPALLNSYEYASLKNEGLLNDGLPEIFTADDLDRFKNGTAPVFYSDINWMDEFFKPVSIQQQYNLNVSGGNDIVRYFTSAGYFDQDGSYKTGNFDYGFDPNPKYRRFNFRSNIDLNFTKDFVGSLKISNLNSIANYPDRDTEGGTSSIFFAVTGLNPMTGPGIIDGKLVTGFINDPLNNKGVSRGGSTYALISNNGYEQFNRNTLNLNIDLKHNLDFITSGLSIRAMGSYDHFYQYSRAHAKTIDTYTAVGDLSDPSAYFLAQRTDESKFTVTQSNNMWRRIYMESSLNYSRLIGSHNITGLLLYN